MVMDPRPPRPSSIELRRNYPEENSGSIYSPRHTQSPGANEMHYRYGNLCSNRSLKFARQGGSNRLRSSCRSNYAMGYDHAIYQQQQQPIYVSGGKQAMDVDLCDHGPSRNGGPRPNSARPTQPPPAPPSTNNSNTRFVKFFSNRKLFGCIFR